jgi:hypothetical protein
MQATAKRFRRARTKLEIAEQLRDRLASEAKARAKAEHDKVLGLAPASPSPAPDRPPPFINWDRVQKRAGDRYLAERAHDKWMRNGGWGDLESGPMPRRHGVLDDPRMRRRLTAQDFTAGIKRC